MDNRRRHTIAATLAAGALVGAGLLTTTPALAHRSTSDAGSSPTPEQGWEPDIDYLVFLRKTAMARDYVALAADRARYGALVGARIGDPDRGCHRAPVVNLAIEEWFIPESC